ncbi:MAG: hydroxyethylthiazole kinase [Oscillospiraceae bacterium]
MMENLTVRNNVPLVHCITNYVTVNDVANVLLACGGSPIMADDINEVADITSISNALVINIGTLNERTIASMVKAGKRANEMGIPVVLDPVGAGASTLRNETTEKLVGELKLAVIRGNLSEVSFIAGLEVSTRGVDSSDADNKNDPVTVARAVAQKYNCTVAITGAVDVISDGTRCAKISNGVPFMSKVTGTGCMLSAVVGAYVGANKDTYAATVKAVASMGIAGEIAYERTKDIGSGSFHIAIIDAINKIEDRSLEKRAPIDEKTA